MNPRLAVSPGCAWCHVYPCVCPRETPCACGGTVQKSARTAVDEAVALHQQTPCHRAWSLREYPR